MFLFSVWRRTECFGISLSILISLSLPLFFSFSFPSPLLAISAATPVLRLASFSFASTSFLLGSLWLVLMPAFTNRSPLAGMAPLDQRSRQQSTSHILKTGKRGNPFVKVNLTLNISTPNPLSLPQLSHSIEPTLWILGHPWSLRNPRRFSSTKHQHSILSIVPKLFHHRWRSC